MTDEALIKKIVKLYKYARKSGYPKRNIARIESHPVSSSVEDLLAFYIAETVPQSIDILISQTFTCATGGKTLILKPTFALIEYPKVLKLFDLKMDLGDYNNFYSYCKERQELLLDVHAKTVKTVSHLIDEEDSEEIFIHEEYKIKRIIKYNIVVVSNANVPETEMKKIEKQVATLDKVNLFILTEGLHPNNTKSKTPTLRLDDFEKLIAELEDI